MLSEKDIADEDGGVFNFPISRLKTSMNQYIKSIFAFPWLLIKHWELLWSFVLRELRAKFEGSVLGRFWPVLQPLVLFAIYYLIFAKLLKIPVSIDIMPWGDPDNLGATMETANAGWRSTFFLITGILPWIAVSECLVRSSGIVLENANLIKKIAFPSELLPTYVVILNHIYFLVGFVVFLIIQLGVNGTLPAQLIWFPLILVLQMIFLLGLGMFVGALNIFIRDVTQIVPLFTMFWMFSSPVFYEPKVLAMLGNPKQSGFVRDLLPYLPINPVYNLLTVYRDIFKFGRETLIVMEERGEDLVPVVKEVLTNQSISYDCLMIFALQAVFTFIVGYAFFLRSKGRFADEV